MLARSVNRSHANHARSDNVRNTLPFVRSFGLQKRLMVAAVAATLFLSCAAMAEDAVTDLLNFVNDTDSAKITFNQTVVDPDGEEQKSLGILYFTRPDQFRLEYRDPVHFTLVSNGRKFWLYDRELNQVTVTRATDNSLASGLLAVLASGDVEREFTLHAAPAGSGDLKWVAVKPLDEERAQFSQSRFAFDEWGNLKRVDIRDLLGNSISAEIQGLQKNPPNEGLYVFKVPTGVEIFDDNF